MIAILPQILRTVIMALATAAPLTALQQFFDGTVTKTVEAVRDEHGLTLDEAKDIVVNILFDLALNASVVGVVIKTKIAVKTAEYLGLTSKGFAKRKLTPKATEAVKKMNGPWEKFKAMSLVSKIITGAGTVSGLTWIFTGLANVVEPGVYEPRQANDVWERFIGFRPFPEKGFSLSPGNFDAERFSGFAQALESAGIKGFNDPINLQSRPYSREGLAAIIDWVYGKAIIAGTKLNDYRNLLPLIQPYLIGTGDITNISVAGSTSSTSSSPTSDVRVFTGIVSQGVLGDGLTFTPRPDDLIENMAELQSAVSNNEAPFLAALPGKIVREIKVVSTVIIGGIQRRGEAQRIQTGTYSNGTPKYKTVVNKFAVGDYYFVTSSGSRTKLARIIYGPTNAVSFQPSAGDLNALAETVQKTIITSNTDDVSVVVSDTPTKDKRREAPATKPAEGQLFDFSFIWIDKRGRKNGGGVQAYDRDDAIPKAEDYAKEREGSLDTGSIISANWEEAGKPRASRSSTRSENTGAGASPPSAPSASQGSQTPAAISPASSLPTTALTAPTLFAFYQAQGLPLPSLDERGRLYQSLNLGQAAFYTGTAEQNTKLLRALQGRPL